MVDTQAWQLGTRAVHAGKPSQRDGFTPTVAPILADPRPTATTRPAGLTEATAGRSDSNSAAFVRFDSSPVS